MHGAPNWEKRLRESLSDCGIWVLKEREALLVAFWKIVSVNQKKKKKKRKPHGWNCARLPPARNDASALCMYLCMYSGRDTISLYSPVTVQTKSELSCSLRCNWDMWRYIWAVKAQYFVSIHQNLPHGPAHICRRLCWSGSFWRLLVFRQHWTFKSFCCWMRVSV